MFEDYRDFLVVREGFPFAIIHNEQAAHKLAKESLADTAVYQGMYDFNRDQFVSHNGIRWSMI